MKALKIPLITILCLTVLATQVSAAYPPSIYLYDLPATATYTIKTDGTNYWYVRYDGFTYSSTNASLVFNLVTLALSTSGGKASIMNGHYDLTAPVYFYNSTTIEGENMYGTVLHKNTNNTDLFRPASLSVLTRGLRIANLKMIGTTGSNGEAIKGNFWQCTFENLVSDYWGTHIQMLNWTGDGAWDNHLFKLWFDHSTYDGIYMGDYESDNTLIDVHVQHAGSSSGAVCAALKIYSSGSHKITDCVFDVSHYCLWMNDASARIKGTSFDQSHDHAIFLQDVVRVTTFQGNKIRDWGNSGGNCSGIYMDGLSTTDNIREIIIEGNWFDANSVGEYDIGFASYSAVERNITIIGNDFQYSKSGAGHWVRALSCYPYTSIVENNVAYVTRNMGSHPIGAGSNTSCVVIHGLAGAPVFVSVSFADTGYGSYDWAATATQITITIQTTISSTVYWEAVYKP